MRIDYSIVSTDFNPLYDGFWDLVKELWINRIGVKPILVCITDRELIEDHGSYTIANLKKN